MTPQQILDSIKQVDDMAKVGSHRHGELLKAALYNNWGQIRVFLERQAYELTQR